MSFLFSGVELWMKIRPKIDSKMESKTGCVFTRSRATKTLPRRFQDAPRCAQDAPRRLQDASRRAKTPPSAGYVGPRNAKDGSKMFGRCLQDAERAKRTERSGSLPRFEIPGEFPFCKYCFFFLALAWTFLALRKRKKQHDATGKTKYLRRAKRAERFKCSEASSSGFLGRFTETAEKNTTT